MNRNEWRNLVRGLVTNHKNVVLEGVNMSFDDNFIAIAYLKLLLLERFVKIRKS